MSDETYSGDSDLSPDPDLYIHYIQNNMLGTSHVSTIALSTWANVNVKKKDEAWIFIK